MGKMGGAGLLGLQAVPISVTLHRTVFTQIPKILCFMDDTDSFTPVSVSRGAEVSLSLSRSAVLKSNPS